MIRLPQKELIKSLKNNGLAVKQFELSIEGEHTVEDSDWNFKDVPHHNQIHPALTHIASSVSHDVASDIRLQKFLGFLTPISNVGFVSKDNRITSHSTFLSFVLIIQKWVWFLVICGC